MRINRTGPSRPDPRLLHKRNLKQSTVDGWKTSYLLIAPSIAMMSALVGGALVHSNVVRNGGCIALAKPDTIVMAFHRGKSNGLGADSCHSSQPR